MVRANDLKGIMAMMPAFTTKDGDRIDATDTVDTYELTRENFSKVVTPECFYRGLVGVSPGFPLKACGNDGL
jgi:hypothetical protein